MKRISVLTIATMTALTIVASSTLSPAFAGKRERQVAAGIFLGLVGGALLAHELNRDRHEYGHRYHSDFDYDDDYEEDIHVQRRRSHRAHKRYGSRSWQRHVRKCSKKYRTYDRRSDTYMGYDGREHQCRL